MANNYLTYIGSATLVINGQTYNLPHDRTHQQTFHFDEEITSFKVTNGGSLYQLIFNSWDMSNIPVLTSLFDNTYNTTLNLDVSGLHLDPIVGNDFLNLSNLKNYTTLIFNSEMANLISTENMFYGSRLIIKMPNFKGKKLVLNNNMFNMCEGYMDSFVGNEYCLIDTMGNIHIPKYEGYKNITLNKYAPNIKKCFYYYHQTANPINISLNDLDVLYLTVWDNKYSNEEQDQDLLSYKGNKNTLFEYYKYNNGEAILNIEDCRKFYFNNSTVYSNIINMPNFTGENCVSLENKNNCNFILPKFKGNSNLVLEIRVADTADAELFSFAPSFFNECEIILKSEDEETVEKILNKFFSKCEDFSYLNIVADNLEDPIKELTLPLYTGKNLSIYSFLYGFYLSSQNQFIKKVYLPSFTMNYGQYECIDLHYIGDLFLSAHTYNTDKTTNDECTGDLMSLPKFKINLTASEDNMYNTVSPISGNFVYKEYEVTQSVYDWLSFMDKNNYIKYLEYSQGSSVRPYMGYRFNEVKWTIIR